MEGKTTIEKLMERGKATGELTTKEISDALEELDFDVDQLNSFYDTCDRLNIKIIDDNFQFTVDTRTLYLILFIK